MKTAMLALLAIFTPVVMAAGATSPVGHWQTIDDKTGKPRAIIEIYTEGNKLFGRLERSYKPGAEHRTCTKCEDDRKDKPMLGLVLIRNLAQDDHVWSGGDILDPDNGSVYRCRLTLSPDGQTLNVRGYIGFAFIGRTQVWHRVTAEQAAAVNPPGQN